MRAANTGISALFDARGHELARLELGKTGVLVEELPGSLPATLYAHLGLIIPITLSLLVIFAAASHTAIGRWRALLRSKNL